MNIFEATSWKEYKEKNPSQTPSSQKEHAAIEHKEVG
jgi:hypothetical protein